MRYRPHTNVLFRGAMATVLTLQAFGCNSEPGAANPQRQTPESINVTVASSRVQPVQRTIEVVGTLYGDEETVISAKVAGRIIAIFRDVGDRVGLNAPLAQLDRIDYELNVNQKRMAIQEALAKLGLDDFPESTFDPARVPTVVRAQRQAANAEARLQRARQLFEQDQPLISEQDFADLQTAFEVARSDYEVALLNAQSILAEAQTRRSELALEQQRLRDTTIRTPEQPLATTVEATPATETGSIETTVATTTEEVVSTQADDRYAVSARLVSVGEYVREGAPMFHLVADNPIKFRARVPERFSSLVKTGQVVHLFVDAYDETFHGMVARVNPQVDRSSRTFEIEVVVRNDAGRLRPGGFARASIFTHVEENVTFVPAEAVVSFAGVKKVYAVQDGRAVELNVQTGVQRDGYVEITEGFAGVADLAVTGTGALAHEVPVQVTGRTTEATAADTRG